MSALTQIGIKIEQQPIILVVENNEDNLIYISQALKLFQYNSIITTDSRNAIALAQEYQPDLLLLDIKMPHLNGLDLLKILKCDWLTRNIPAVAVTALARKMEKKIILDAGFEDYLIKPFLLEELRSVVWSHIKDNSLPNL